MWRDTGNSRYLADTFGWDTLPLTDGGLADAKLSGQFGHSAGCFDRSGGDIGHKRKVSQPYEKVNKAFAELSLSGTYSSGMFKETIRRLRKAKGLTQKQLAKKMGVTAPAVTQWEAGGGIDTENLGKLADALETPLEVLARALEHDRLSQDSDRSAENLPTIKSPDDTIATVTTPQ